MSRTAITALEKALKLDDLDAVRAEISRGLASLQQQPDVLDDFTLHARMNREIAKHGSLGAAAKAWGVTKQTIFCVLNADRPCPPAILRHLGLRRSVKRIYSEI